MQKGLNVNTRESKNQENGNQCLTTFFVISGLS